MDTPEHRPARAGRLFVAFWGLALSAVVVGLMIRHWTTLPVPTVDDPVARSGLAQLRLPQDVGRPLVVHAIYTRCRCSLRILDHLAQSTRPAGVSEVLLAVGPADERVERAAANGLRVVHTTREELSARYHLRGAPVLAVLGADNVLRYIGGYTSRKQGPEPEDLEIVAEALQGQTRSPLPLFGCAVSAALADDVNPFGLPD